MAMVQFWVLVGVASSDSANSGELFIGPEIDKDEPLALLFRNLTRDKNGAGRILVDANIGECKLYGIKQPVRSGGKERNVVKACYDARERWVLLDRTELVKDLVQDEKCLTRENVCLVIQPPQAKEKAAVDELRQDRYRHLFEALQISLQTVNTWTRDDVSHNMNSGSFWEHRAPRTFPAMSELESSLTQKRGYSDTQIHDGQGRLDFETAQAYPNDFLKYFMNVITRSYGVRNTREFVGFFSVLRSHKDDAQRVSEEPSSAFKASYLSSYYFIPPFFSCQPQNSKTAFKADMPWKFPIFLNTRDQPSSWCKTIPKSDYSVISRDFTCPFMLCEVISEPNEQDRWRMLLQAIAAARVGRCFQESMTSTPFFVVAIYLRANLTAERYIVMQTASNGMVSIAQTNFNLLEPDEALAFLREMFNLQEKIDKLIRSLDDSNKGILQEIERIARNLPSHSKQKAATKPTRSTHSMPPVQEDTQEQDESTQQNAFTNDPEITEHLDNMGYKLEMVLFGFEHVAMISRKSNEFDRGFLKLTLRRREVEIIQYLAGIDAPDNHTIPDVKVWQRRSGGFVLYTSSGGGHITALRQPDEHLWSTASQLIEGVAFMHKHSIAHRDIKPANVLIPPDGGRLSIIDFSIAVRVDGSGSMEHGLVGTDDYMAPEVEAQYEYDPVRADLWSCGRTLQDLCRLCRPSMQNTFLLDISQALMATDPLQRPMMQDVLAHMATLDSTHSELHPHMRLSVPLATAEARS